MKTLFKKLAFYSLFAIIGVLATATIIEKFFGSEVALSTVYHSWWFVILWCVCAVSSVLYVFKTKLPTKPAAFLVHIALLLILLGAGMSFCTSKRGLIHIRQGEVLNYFLMPKANGETVREQLPFNLKLLLFSKTPLSIVNGEIMESNDEKLSDKAFFSYLQIDDKTCCVWLNHIYEYQHYRFYQYEFDSDEHGVTLLVNRDPYGIAITYAGYLLLLIAALWLLCRKLKWRWMLAVCLPTAAVWFFISQIKPMTPVLRSPMLAAHVSVIMISYVLLLLIAILSAVELTKDKKLKTTEESGKANDEGKLSKICRLLLYPAVFLLAIGIFIGAVWANISWGRYWGWDSKETWALITLLVYAIPFHKHTFPKFQEAKFFHRYLLFAFFSVLMTFLGVSFLLGGMHSYL
ncbi:MAG: cytochrome c biogenesis protein CcsA [Paludibacter sp.]|jgi:hypothetical protein|nr:cytochrome c biogenesis protein CcsA [Paludibacter sp.]